MSKTTPATKSTDIFIESLRTLNAKSRQALMAIHTFVTAAQELAGQRDADRATSELADFRRQTFEAIESGRSTNPILRDFAKVVQFYKIDEECIEALFASLRMQVNQTNFNVREYRQYIAGAGEAVGLMTLRVLCYRRAVVYHKLMPAGRALGAAICKIILLQEHGRTHKRHGRMHFPDVTKTTFNQARLAQVIVDIEADFRVARNGIPGLPPGTKHAVAQVYSYYYELLRQMRHLTPAQIDAGRANISGLKKLYLGLYSLVAPLSAVRRGQSY